MKSIYLILAAFFFVACGGGSNAPQQVEIPPNSDIRADVAFKVEGDLRRANVLFYLSTPVAPGDKAAPPQRIISVEDPKINDVVLNPETNEAGFSYYTTTDANQLPTNVVSARINGRMYEGRTIPGPSVPNKQMAVTLVPK